MRGSRLPFINCNLVGEARWLHFAIDPALFSEEIAEVTYCLVGALAAAIRLTSVELVVRPAFTPLAGSTSERRPPELRDARKQGRNRAGQFAVIGLRGKFEQQSALISSQQSHPGVDSGRSRAETDDPTAQGISFVDADESAIDDQIIVVRGYMALDSLHPKPELAQSLYELLDNGL